MPTEIYVSGFGAFENVIQQVDATHKAARVSVRPAETASGGSYSQAFASGVMAAGLAAGSVIFAWQWQEKSLLCVPRRVRITAGTDAIAFAQGSCIFDVIRATSFTAQYTAGATVNILGKSGAKATRMNGSAQVVNNSAVGVVAVAGTAALAAGTPAPALDSNPMGVIVGSVGAAPATLLAPPPGYLLDYTDSVRTPPEIIKNEGFVIRATVPATGTWKFGIEVDWDEVAPNIWLM